MQVLIIWFLFFFPQRDAINGKKISPSEKGLNKIHIYPTLLLERGFFNNTWISYKDTLCRNQASTSEKMCLNNGKHFTFWQPLELHNKNFVTLCSVMNSWCKSLNFPLSSNSFLKRTLEKQEVNGKRICQVTIPGGLWLSHPLGMVLMVGGKGSWKMSQWSWNAALLVTELCWSCIHWMLLFAWKSLRIPGFLWRYLHHFTA